MTRASAAIIVMYTRLFRHLRDDIASEANLAALGAARAGRDEAAAVKAALRRLTGQGRREFDQGHAEGLSYTDMGSRAKPVPLYPARKLTPGQVRRLRRNVAIQVMCRGGLSHRHIAEVVNLPHSEVSRIIGLDLAAPFRLPEVEAE